MNKRPYIYLPLFFALVLILGIFLGTFLYPAFHSKNGIFTLGVNEGEKVQSVISYIEGEYVDSLSHDDLVKYAINGLLQQLDPHSSYISKEEFNEANDPLKGNFDGIGIQFRIIRDSLTVISLIPGGPSEREGLLPGDRIIMVDEKTVASVNISNEDAIHLLKGPRGTKVKTRIYRKTQKRFFDFNITRGNIPTSSIDFSYMVNRDIGYIKISRFSATTSGEFLDAAHQLSSQGMTKLILDLRGNGGGLLDAAVEIADQFLGEDELIVYTEGYHRPRQSYFSNVGGSLKNTRLAILIDEFSASASEILAGAIQDNDRGSIVGRRSFGKGLVQEQIPLPDSSALRLTIARYYTPTGRCIQKPYTDDFEKYYADFYKQFMSDEEYQDSLNFVDTTRFLTPKGKVVYGGGGIMPDEYVSARSEYSSDYYKKLLSRGLIINFSFDYADREREKIMEYRDAAKFLKEFVVSPQLFEELIKYAGNHGLARDPDEIAISEKMIKAELKGQIGRVIFNDPAYYPITLPEDKVFQRAVEVLNK